MPIAVGVMADSYNKPVVAGPPLTGLVGWYDAADTATITVSTATNVASMADKSTVARHLNSPNSVKTATRTLNGHNVLEFPSSGAYLSATGGTWTYPQPVTIAVAVQMDVATGLQWFVHHAGGGAALATYTDKWALHGGSWIYGTASDTASHVLVGHYQGASSQLWKDGVSIVTGNASTGGITGGPTIGYCDGIMGEVLYYSRALSTVERQQVESYLKAKWGTP